MSGRAILSAAAPIPAAPRASGWRPAGLGAPTGLRLAGGLAFLIGLFLLLAHAEDGPGGALLDPGQLVVTGFSGTVLADSVATGAGAGEKIDATFLDVDGAVMRILEAGGARPGAGRDGAAAEAFTLTAREVGQVFGVALDDRVDEATGRPAPDIFLGASSAYGLHLVLPDDDGDGWPTRTDRGGPGARFMDGQHGTAKGGGPGAVWKVDGVTGEVTLFAQITDRGEPNSGPGLGNLAYDAETGSLYVSDLDTGLIVGLDQDGRETGSYDHGLFGREAEGLPAFEDDPDDRADITSPAFKTGDPATWGFAAPPRRVWGLKARAGRLYYAVAEGPEVWSVGLGPGGAFVDPRREIALPPGVEPYEIADIAFSADGTMILAQRPPVTGAYDYVAVVAKGPARVLRYRPAPATDDSSHAERRWIEVPDEHAIGLTGEHRNAAGGVALGYGYKAEGGLDYTACEATLWATGEHLRSDAAGALKVEKVPGFEASAIDGLQGSDLAQTRPGNAPPEDARFLDYDGNYVDSGARGHVGDVEIPYGCTGDWLPEDQLPYWSADHASPGPAYAEPGLDLAVEKRALGTCKAGGICRFEIRILNTGTSVYYGPLVIGDTLSGAALTLVGSGPAPWSCSEVGRYVNCHRTSVYLKPGRSQSLTISLRVSSAWTPPRLESCAAVDWLAGADPNETVRAVQNELARRGYYAGAADGLLGHATRSAVETFAADAALAPSPEINHELIVSLFGPGAFRSGDSDDGNDRACAVHKVAAAVAAARPHVIAEAPADAPVYLPPAYYPTPKACPPGFAAAGSGPCVRWCPPGTYDEGGHCVYDEPAEIVCRGGSVPTPEGQCACPSGSIEVSSGVRTRCVALLRVRCYGGSVHEGVCACPLGFDRARIGSSSYICLPEPDLSCVAGYPWNGRCACWRPSDRLVQTGPVEFQCMPRQTGGPICIGGIARLGRCFCPGETDPVKLASGVFRCASDEAIRCIGGTPDDGRCECPRGERATRIGRLAWRCKDAGEDGIACLGGTARSGKCWCGKARVPKRLADGIYRCVKDEIASPILCRDGKPPRLVDGALRCPRGGKGLVCLNGRVEGSRCTCSKGDSLRQLGAARFVCVDQGKDATGGATAGGVESPTVAGISCIDGVVRRGTCVCRENERVEPLGANRFRCAKRPQSGSAGSGKAEPDAITCAGGKVAGKRCVCGPKERAVEAGDNNFRCVAATAKAGHAGGDKKIICLGGSVKERACVCAAGERRVRVSAGNFRCEAVAKGKKAKPPAKGAAGGGGNAGAGGDQPSKSGSAKSKAGDACPADRVKVGQRCLTKEEAKALRKQKKKAEKQSG